MISVIEQWYQALVDKDTETIYQLLDPSLYGLRFYDGTLCYTRNDVLDRLHQSRVQSIRTGIIEEYNGAYHYQVTIIEQDIEYTVDAKMVLKDRLVHKLYERLQDNSTRYKVICAYDGSAFYGFQKQPNTTTVQGTLEQAICTAFQLDEITIHASGRTDKGVHAINQVFHMDLTTKVPTNKIGQLIQAELPDSILIKHVSDVPSTFHSRYDVIEKTYQYKINIKEFDPIQRNYEWYVDGLEIDQLKRDAQALLGTHDFQSFTKQTNQPTIRTIHSVSITEEGQHLLIQISGTGFLRYMVRYIVYALVQSNKGNISYSIPDLLQQQDVSLLKEMAPAGGLYLYDVRYQ